MHEWSIENNECAPPTQHLVALRPKSTKRSDFQLLKKPKKQRNLDKKDKRNDKRE